RQRGLEVTVIDPQPLPSERLFGRDVASFYHDVHAKHGIEFLLGDGVEAFEGNGAVSRVRTASGRRVECDFAVVGIGVVPRTGLASDAGLEVSNGLVTDANLQTAAPGIFAAGGVATAWPPFYHRRIGVDHWANALNQGPAAARALLGDRAGDDPHPELYSDQED